MKDTYEVIVIGIGGMGSSTALSLARRGVQVLGIEQFQMAHNLGSSHGERRMIRQAYFEHPDYVPLLRKAYQYWDDLCAESGQQVFHRTGLLLAATEKSSVLSGAIASAGLHGIPVREINPNQLKSEFPQFSFPSDFFGVHEPGGGFLEVELAIKAFCKLAVEHGAVLNFNEKVHGWKTTPAGIEVTTDKSSYLCQKLILTAGPWTSTLLNKLDVPLKVRRVFQFWFKAPAHFKKIKSSFPCFGFDTPEGFFYGFPENEGLIKMASHTPGSVVIDPTTVDRTIVDDDWRELKNCLSHFMPEVSTVPVKSSVCLYTLTPDEHFVIDFHPQYSNVVFAGGFSGHGYKFASVVGPILADLALEGKTNEPISFLKLRW